MRVREASVLALVPQLLRSRATSLLEFACTVVANALLLAVASVVESGEDPCAVCAAVDTLSGFSSNGRA